jgi:hypothetical protein
MRVHDISIRRDYRFTLEEQWKDIVPLLVDGVTAITVMDFDAKEGIVGWFLHGWKPPPPLILRPNYDFWWNFEW